MFTPFLSFYNEREALKRDYMFCSLKPISALRMPLDKAAFWRQQNQTGKCLRGAFGPVHWVSKDSERWNDIAKFSELESVSRWLFVTPGPVAHLAPPSRKFSRQEYWSGLPSPSPKDLPNPRIKPKSPVLQADFLLSEPPERPRGKS